jgi:hypothetical protein
VYTLEDSMAKQKVHCSALRRKTFKEINMKLKKGTVLK